MKAGLKLEIYIYQLTDGCKAALKATYFVFCAKKVFVDDFHRRTLFNVTILIPVSIEA